MRNIYISIGLTLIFWLILFIMTPYDSLKNERDIKNEKQEQLDNLPTHEKVNEFLKDYNEPKKNNYLIISVYAYLLIQFIVIIFNKNIAKWTIYNISFLVSTFGLFIAFGYFLKTRDLYDYGFNALREYRFIFNLLSIVPITLITYQIFRLTYKYFFNMNPRIVGKAEFFTEPSNYLFSVLVFISGAFLTVFIDLIGFMEKLINHFA